MAQLPVYAVDIPTLNPLESGRGETTASAIIKGQQKDFQDLMAAEVQLLSRKLLLRDNMATFAEYEDAVRRHNAVKSALLDVPHNWAAEIMAKLEGLDKKVEAIGKDVEAISKDVGAMNKTVDDLGRISKGHTGQLQGFRNILNDKLDDRNPNQTDAIKKELQEFKTGTEERHQAFAMQLGKQMDILRDISNASHAHIAEAELLNVRTQELTGNAVLQQHP